MVLNQVDSDGNQQLTKAKKKSKEKGNSSDQKVKTIESQMQNLNLDRVPGNFSMIYEIELIITFYHLQQPN